MTPTLKIIFLCIVAFAVPVYTAKKCYQCENFKYLGSNETFNPENCKKNPPEDKFLVSCAEDGVPDPSEGWQCVKVTGRIEVDEENFDYIRRYCSPGKRLDATCKDTKSFETEHGFVKRGKQCVCDADDCNAASSVTVGALTIVSSLLIAAVSRL